MPFDRRRLRYGSNALVSILALAGLVVLLNAIAERRFKRWDWTGSRIYSLSEKTLAILSGLRDDIDVTVLLQPDAEAYEEVREILNKYRSHNTHIRLEFLDPAREPARVGQLLQRFGIDPRGDTTAVVFSRDDRHKHVSTGELVEYDFAGALGGSPRIKAFKGEIAFTSAILTVTQERQRGLCFLRGHDEVDPHDSGARGMSRLAEALSRENMRVDTTDSLGRSPLPEDCDALVIAGPTRGFAPPEAEALGAYLDGGGRVLALIDPPFSREGSLQRLGIEEVFLARGIGLGDDIVLDPSQRLLFGTAESFAASDFFPHAITKGLSNTFIVLGLVRSAAPVQPPPEGWSVAALARTTGEGWGERDLAQLERVRKGPEDLAGPVVFATAAENRREGPTHGRLVVIGDSDIGQNQFIGAYANLDFLLNAVNWLTGTEEQIGISPREPEQVQMTMTGAQERLVVLATLLGMPGFVILAGIVVWLFRRR